MKVGALVEGHDERFVAAVAVQNQKIAVEHGGIAVAVLRLVRQSRLPDDVTRRREGRGTFGAEVDDRRRVEGRVIS